MIYLIFVQYMKLGMQIVQERSDYAPTTNTVTFMQERTSSLLKKVTITFATNTYCSPFT